MVPESSDHDVPSDVDTGRLRIPDFEAVERSDTFDFVGDAVIVLTQAFCQKHHELITPGNETFAGHPGVRVLVGHGEEEFELTISPIHGHHARKGGGNVEDGTRVRVSCPVCKEELVAYAPCPCGKGTLRSIYLTSEAEGSHVAAVCDVWGCQRSRVVDEWELLSEFVE
jgi:hypothetical protein